MSASAFRRCLETCDAAGIRALSAEMHPHLPQPESDADALIGIHMARTQTASMPFKLRAYSHRWLLDHNLPSQLPDDLKPKAESIYPKVVQAVGIAVKMAPDFEEVRLAVQAAMSDAVNELHADGVDLDDQTLVHGRMFEARARTLRGYFGRGVNRVHEGLL